MRLRKLQMPEDGWVAGDQVFGERCRDAINAATKCFTTQAFREADVCLMPVMEERGEWHLIIFPFGDFTGSAQIPLRALLRDAAKWADSGQDDDDLADLLEEFAAKARRRARRRPRDET